MTLPTTIPTPGQSPRLVGSYATTLPTPHEDDDCVLSMGLGGPPSAFPAHFTPASTPSRASFSGPPSPKSRMISGPPSPEEGLDTAYIIRDLQLSGSVPRSPAFGPASSSLPASAGYFDMSSAPARAGLMRRLSRGAQNKLRRGPSFQSGKNREQSSGPVAVRRKGEGTSLLEGTSHDVSDFELDGVDDTQGRLGSLGMEAHEEVDDLDAIPIALSLGTLFEEFRVEKPKKSKFTKIYLDESGSKIVWSFQHSSSSSLKPIKQAKQIYLDVIKGIRTGEDAREYLDQFERPASDAPRWITIDYIAPDKRKGRTDMDLHLLAPDAEVASQWVKYLDHLVHDRGDLMAGFAGNSERHRRKEWKRRMLKKGVKEPLAGRMDFDEIAETCKRFSIRKPEKALRLQFDAVDKEKKGFIDLDQFLSFFRQLTESKDIRNLFNSIRFSSSSPNLQLAEFLGFLRNKQGEDVDADPEYWERIFVRFATRGRNLSAENPHDLAEVERGDAIGMSFEAFRDFLSSNPNTALKGPSHSETLDRPLNEYIISSSHNTYLMGWQWNGEARAEAYRDVLMKGCRCIEIDCWDGSGGKPRVTHARTNTTSVSFIDCIKTVNKYAFVASPYPLIISLEVHCGPEQQQVMTDIMKEQFGDSMILSPLDRREGRLPSPEQLKWKILIKVKAPMAGKRAAHSAQVPVAHRRQRSVSAPGPPPASNPGLAIRPHGITESSTPYIPTPLRSATLDYASPIAGPSVTKKPSIVSSSEDESGFDFELEDSLPPENQLAKKSKTSNIIQSLGELGVYAQGITFSSFDDPVCKKYNHIFSFSESDFIARCKKHHLKEQLESHNARFLMRVYPRGSRVQSTNFDPIQFWRRGVQMAATNWQNRDLGTQINDAMFAAGKDQKGYVLKPVELRPPHQRFSQNEAIADKLPKLRIRFSIHIYSASMLEDWSGGQMNPYIDVELLLPEDKAKDNARGEGGANASARSGMSGIGAPVRQRLRLIEGNGYDPRWDETCTFEAKTKYPDLVFVRLTVWNSHDGKTISAGGPFAQFTAKLSTLAQGYRFFSLKNAHGQTTISKLFCHVGKQAPELMSSDPTPVGNLPESRRVSEETTRSSRFGNLFSAPRRMSSNKGRSN